MITNPKSTLIYLPADQSVTWELKSPEYPHKPISCYLPYYWLPSAGSVIASFSPADFPEKKTHLLIADFAHETTFRSMLFTPNPPKPGRFTEDGTPALSIPDGLTSFQNVWAKERLFAMCYIARGEIAKILEAPLLL